jgi:electron transfer flavoprotein alpha subunit
VVDAVVVGGEPAGVASLGEYGVRMVHLIDDAAADAYTPAAWATGLQTVIAAGDVAAVVAPGGERGTEVLAHVAARMGGPMAANVTAVTPGDRWAITRQRWAGSLLEAAWLDGDPRLLTSAPHAVVAAEPSMTGASATVTRIQPAIPASDLRVRLVGREAATAGSIALADARVVVGGGRGMGSAESFAMLEELASLLGAAVGVSRVATSLGWRPHAQQIGQTGTRIAPDLYIACGISGAIQHIVGCKAAKRILVINTDRDAPIFSRATYGVVGDVHAVVPAIIDEVRRTAVG